MPDVTKAYEFIGLGAMDVTKPYKFIGFGAMDVTKPCEFIGFGAMHRPGRERIRLMVERLSFLAVARTVRQALQSGASVGGGGVG